MPEPLQPGEIELEDDPAPAGDPPPADDPAPDDPAADDPPPGDDPAPAGDPPTPKQAPRGAVKELIDTRNENKQLRQRLQQLESHPVLQRLTPDIQQAILEGRVQIAAPKANREAEKERLTEVAEKLGLSKGDGTLDLDAARRVSEFVRDEVRAGVEPVRQGSLAQVALSNKEKALEHARANGFDVDTVTEVFDEVLRQPNGAELVSQKSVCETLWRQAVGMMHERGKPPKGAPPAKGGKDKPPVAIITEPRGPRGGTQTGVQISSPTLQRIYKDQGLDPNKGFSSTSKRPISPFEPIDLE